MSIYDDAVNLIESEDFVIRPNSITCFLKVGDSDFIGTSHLFNNKNADLNRGKESAKNKAIEKIIESECYHLKRVRNQLSEEIGLRFLPSYSFAIGNDINVNVSSKKEISSKTIDGVFKSSGCSITLSFYSVGSSVELVDFDYKDMDDLRKNIDAVIEKQVNKMVAAANS